MRYNICRILTLAAVCVAGTMQGRTLKGYAVATQAGDMGVQIDSVAFRDDVTRIYGKLTGKPHTSNRIDRFSLVLSSGVEYVAEDIDGVDMERWFQWEESGEIMLEVDFPTMKPIDKFCLKTSGPKGASEWNVNRRTYKAKKK